MQADKPFHVLISGASVAGLSTAYWLARYGFQVTVVERAPHLRAGGQALDVRGPALEVAKRMGILDTLQGRSTKLTGMSVVDAEGKETFRTTERTMTGGRLDSTDIEILRDDLCKVLYDAVGDHVAFQFDDKITSITQDTTGVDVAFAKGKPHCFDLVIGADGLYSGVRRLAFGPDKQFLHYLGQNIAVFSMPNFLGLDHWELLNMHGDVGGLMLAQNKGDNARMYLGFGTKEPLDYDYRDIAAQKRLLAERFAGAGWEYPRILKNMQEAPDFYFYATHQVRMDSWSRGRVALVGDAGYCVSPASGQGTTIAMVAAYVLAGELATQKQALLAGVSSYEREVHDYVNSNLAAALESSAKPQESISQPDAVPDFGKMVQPISLRNYEHLTSKASPGPGRSHGR